MTKRTLDRILQSQGFGTRKHCRELVRAGEVRVGGQAVADATAEFDTEGLAFEVFGEEWLFRQSVYLALNKPPGYECSRKPSHHPGVLTLLPEQFAWRDVQPVGRLDHDTTGLLLLSDDGAFIHAQSSPRRHVPKTYVATTQAPVGDELVDMLEAGVQLKDEPAPLACRARRLEPHAVEMILDEGKYHQVKRMLAAAGNHCVALRRAAIGGLTLAALGLAEGAWTYLDDTQLALLAERP
ncbi:MAG TPA: 16S rRNA pseudouridine(516) synthase [Rhodocyclaceae bacterium]